MKYELVYILSPKLSEDDAKKEVEKLQKKMEQKGGTIERSDFWGRRKLAYEIRHMSHGYYVLVVFSAEGNDANEISLMFNIEKEVLRHLVIKYEGETKVSLAEESEEKLIPQKKEALSEDAPQTKREKPLTKKEKPAKKEKAEEDTEDIDKKLDEILDKI